MEILARKPNWSTVTLTWGLLYHPVLKSSLSDFICFGFRQTHKSVLYVQCKAISDKLNKAKKNLLSASMLRLCGGSHTHLSARISEYKSSLKPNLTGLPKHIFFVPKLNQSKVDFCG